MITNKLSKHGKGRLLSVFLFAIGIFVVFWGWESDKEPAVLETFPERVKSDPPKEIKPPAEEPAHENVENNMKPSERVLVSSKKITTFSIDQVNELARRFHLGNSHGDAKYRVEKWEITFTTRHEKNQKTTGHALVYLPVGDGPFSILGSAAGTTGIDPACAPSRENVSVANWGDYEGYNTSFAGQGYAVVFPDYSGFNNDTWGLHHYFVADLEAMVVLDSLNALQNLAEDNDYALQSEIYLSGYSQGTHAIFAAADIWADYAPHLPIKGLIAYGAINNTIDLLRFNADLGPYLLYAYEDLYGAETVNASALLQPSFAENLDKNYKKCISDVGSHYGYEGDRVYTKKLWDSLINGTLESEFPELYKVLSKNITGHGPWKFSTLILQSTTDHITPPEINKRLLNLLCEDKKPTTYREITSTSHVFTRQRSFFDTIQWIETVRSGENFLNSCETR